MENLFKRIGTAGWLLLSGNCPSLSIGQPNLAERLLSIVPDKPEIVVFTPDNNLLVEIREFVDDLTAFFDVESSIVNLSSATDEFMQDAWLRASLMILVQGTALGWIDLLANRLFISRPDEILGPGNVLLVIGQSVAAVGRWIYYPEEQHLGDGLNWVEDAIFLPDVNTPASIEEVRTHLLLEKGSYAVGLPEGSLLGIGPEGEIEVWSEIVPVVTIDVSA